MSPWVSDSHLQAPRRAVGRRTPGRPLSRRAHRTPKDPWNSKSTARTAARPSSSPRPKPPCSPSEVWPPRSAAKSAGAPAKSARRAKARAVRAPRAPVARGGSAPRARASAPRLRAGATARRRRATRATSTSTAARCRTPSLRRPTSRLRACPRGRLRRGKARGSTGPRCPTACGPRAVNARSRWGLPRPDPPPARTATAAAPWVEAAAHRAPLSVADRG
jgi:hypothetical protein